MTPNLDGLWVVFVLAAIGSVALVWKLIEIIIWLFSNITITWG